MSVSSLKKSGAAGSGGGLTGAHRQASHLQDEDPSPIIAVGASAEIAPNAAGGGGNISPAIPAGAQNGDTLVAIVVFAGQTAPVMNATTGWTEVNGPTTMSSTPSTGAAGTRIGVKTAIATMAAGLAAPSWPMAGTAHRGARGLIIALRPEVLDGTIVIPNPSSGVIANSVTKAVDGGGAAKRYYRALAFMAWTNGDNAAAPQALTGSPTGTSGATPDATITSVSGLAQGIGLAIVPNAWLGGQDNGLQGNFVVAGAGTINVQNASVWVPDTLGLPAVTDQGQANGLTVTPRWFKPGPWTELFSAASFSAKALELTGNFDGDNSANHVIYDVEIGVGVAGLESVVGKTQIDRMGQQYGTGVDARPEFNPTVLIPVTIPAGSRVAVRVKRRSPIVGATSGVGSTPNFANVYLRGVLLD